MNCLKCGREVVEQAKFCSYCGERITVECTSCGIPNPSDGLYCLDCGRSLTGSQVEQLEHASTYHGQMRSPMLECSECQTANEPESLYCYECRLPLEDETNTQPMRARLYGLYQSPRTRANWTVGLLIAMCVAFTLQIIMTLGVLDLVSAREAEQAVLRSELEGDLSRLDVISVLVFWMYIATVVWFLMWMHRTSKNLETLGSHGQRFSPGEAVGYWFIPMAWFVFPYLAMAEIWRGSSPDAPRGVDWKNGAVSALLGWWWGLWITHILCAFAGYDFGIVGAIVQDLYWDDWNSSLPSVGALRMDLLSGMVGILAGIFAILVVLRTTRRQEVKYGRMMAG